MNPNEIFEKSLNEFKAFNLNFHSTYLNKRYSIQHKIEELRDVISNESTQLSEDKVNQLEKEYESALKTFLSRQHEIEETIEPTKQIFKSICEPQSFDSNKFSIVMYNLYEAEFHLKTAQKQLEQLEFVYELEFNNDTPSHIQFIKVFY